MKKLKSLCKSKFERENIKRKGIYSIYFKDNKKYYVGSTNCKEGFRGRWREHVYELRKNIHKNTILQRTYNKYGENFFFEILEIYEGSDEQVREREQFYLDLLRPELNVNLKATGCEFPEDWVSPNSVPILQYDLDGNFIKEYKSINEAKLDCFISDIHQALRNSKLFLSSAGGFQWRLKESNDYPLKIEKYKYAQSHEILCYDSNGNFIREYDSILTASKDLNLCTGNISRNVRGKTRSCNGYFFKRKENDNYPLKINELLRVHKKQYCVDIEDLMTGEKFHFNSLREIPEKITNRSVIRPYMLKGLTEFTISKKDKSKKYFFKITKL